ncbi:MAG: DUF4249 domain-containing protein [Flavisolibacter sp.]
MRIKQFLIITLILVASCRQPYNPPAVKVNNNFLVVDGFLNATPNSVTTISLSRTRNLVDTINRKPEENAEVFIEEASGVTIRLSPQGNGLYSSSSFINPSGSYQLKITTIDGSQYQSEFVPVVNTPPIDSLTWEQKDDARIFVFSHNPANNIWYYHWDYTETWEYVSNFETVYGVNSNNIIFERDTSNQIYHCWRNNNSTDIVIGNSLKLNQDIINHFPITVIPQNSAKIAIRYSILVNQYGLTKEGYEFWQTLQKNTQQVGSIFDPQPSQLKSNIHNITNPKEPVMGFFSASTVQQKRIFINHRNLVNWVYNGPDQPGCSTKELPSSFPYYNYPDTTFVPYYFTAGGNIMVIIQAPCVDCTRHGGTNHKPSYW